MSSSFLPSGGSTNLVGARAVGAGSLKSEKDIDVSTENINAQLTSVLASDTNPDELTFGEGTVFNVPSSATVLRFCARYGWWNGSPPKHFQLHNAQVLSHSPAFFPFLTM
jgi:hypothetical protein